MLEAGDKQDYIAEVTGWSQQQVSRIANGAAPLFRIYDWEDWADENAELLSTTLLALSLLPGTAAANSARGAADETGCCE